MTAMHRQHIPSEDLLRGEATLAGEDARHLRDVLRLREGARVEAFDGHGNTRAMSVAETAKRHIRLVASGEALPHAPPAVRMTLFTALFKPSRMDWLIEKAVELGAWHVVGVATARSVVKVENAQRWRRIAREALRQCGGAWEPEMRTLDFAAFCGEVAAMTQRGGAVWFGDLSKGAPLLFSHQPSAFSLHECAWCVGPEGDFTPEEMEALRKAGARGVSLGPRVLRSETAGIFGLCALALQSPMSQSPEVPMSRGALDAGTLGHRDIGVMGHWDIGTRGTTS